MHGLLMTEHGSMMVMGGDECPGQVCTMTMDREAGLGEQFEVEADFVTMTFL